MPIDSTKLGVTTAQLMEQLENNYDGDATIDRVIVIAAISDGPGHDTVHFSVSPGMASYVGRGILDTVQDRIRLA